MIYIVGAMDLLFLTVKPPPKKASWDKIPTLTENLFSGLPNINTQKKISSDEFQEGSKIIKVKVVKYEISDLQGQ